MAEISNIKMELKYDIFFWYFDKQSGECNPLKIVEQLEKEYKKIWSRKDYQNEEIHQLVLKMKESKIVILGFSNEFSTDKLCIQIFNHLNILNKNYIKIELGKRGEHEWLENPIFVSVCSDLRVIIQEREQFNLKLVELFDLIETQLRDIKEDSKEIDVFISYCWKNSHDAVKKGTLRNEKSLSCLDPRELYSLFRENGLNVWLDIHNLKESRGMFEEMSRGLNKAKVVVACISDDYVNSQNCKLEFRFAHCSLRKPIIKCIVGKGNQWRKDEVSFLAQNYPEVSFQHQETKKGYY
jgi:leucine-rich repeat kinase 2